MSTLSSLRELLALTETRGDISLGWVVKLQMARIALLNGDGSLPGILLSQLSQSAGLNLPMSNIELDEHQVSTAGKETAGPRSDQSKTEDDATWEQPKLARAVIAQFLVLLSIWLSDMGEMKVAKSTVKRAHAMLDEGKLEGGESEGWVKVSGVLFNQPSLPGLTITSNCVDWHQPLLAVTERKLSESSINSIYRFPIHRSLYSSAVPILRLYIPSLNDRSNRSNGQTAKMHSLRSGRA